MKKRAAPKKNPNLHLLWPTPILIKKYGQHQKVNKELMELFTKHRKSHQTTKSDMFASKDDIYELYKDNPALQKLVKFIMDGVFEIASEVNAHIGDSLKVSKLKSPASGFKCQMGIISMKLMSTETVPGQGFIMYRRVMRINPKMM